MRPTLFRNVQNVHGGGELRGGMSQGQKYEMPELLSGIPDFSYKVRN